MLNFQPHFDYDGIQYVIGCLEYLEIIGTLIAWISRLMHYFFTFFHKTYKFMKESDIVIMLH